MHGGPKEYLAMMRREGRNTLEGVRRVVADALTNASA
jgi:hypothetical protein